MDNHISDLHTLIPGVVPNPGPGVAISRDILMGVYHLFISCQKHILSNKRTIYDAYINEYDRCVLAGYDNFTCHQRGVYAANVSWDNKYRGIPMVAPAPEFPSLTEPPPNPNPIGVGSPLRKDRGPPFGHPPRRHFSHQVWPTGLPLILAQILHTISLCHLGAGDMWCCEIPQWLISQVY